MSTPAFSSFNSSLGMLVVLVLALLLPQAGRAQFANVRSNAWNSVTILPARPPATFGYAAAHARAYIYVFGGVAQQSESSIALELREVQNITNAMWRKSEAANTWVQLPIPPQPGAWPEARLGATLSSLVIDGLNVLVLLGGSSSLDFNLASVSSSAIYGDVWWFFPHNLTWVQPDMAPGSPAVARVAATASTLNSTTIAVFGGISSTLAVTNDVWLYSILSRSWTPLEPASTSPRPPARFGHMASILDGSVLYIVGGQNATLTTADGRTTGLVEERTVWGIDLASASPNWTAVSWQPNAGPEPLSFGGMVPLGNNVMVLFGGILNTVYYAAVRDMFMFNSTSQEWKLIGVYKAQAGFQLRAWFTPVATDLYVFVFGGRTLLTALDDVILFNPVTLTWTPQLQVTGPPPAIFTATTSVDAISFLYGGFGGTTVVPGSLWVLDGLLGQWRLAPTTSELEPPALIGTTLTLVGRSLFLTLGFNTDSDLPSVWVYDLDSYAWSAEPVTASQPIARLGHTTSLYRRVLDSAPSAAAAPFPAQALIVFGGCRIEISAGGLSYTFLNDVHVFDVGTRTWNTTATGRGGPPGRRAFHAAALFYHPNGAAVYILGGTSFDNVRDDMWMLTVPELQWSPVDVDPVISTRWGAISHQFGLKWLVGTGSLEAETVFGTSNNITASTFLATNDGQPRGSIEWVPVTLQPTLPRALATSFLFILEGPLTILAMMGGSTSTSALSQDVPIYTILGCSPGTNSSNFQAVACAACPRGSYQPFFGFDECYACPVGTTTPSAAATSPLQCTECQADYCSGHGVCSVSIKDSAATASCDCDENFSGATCDVADSSSNTRQWVIPLILALVIIFGVLVFFLVRRERSKKTFHFFISYRVATDAALARRVRASLHGLALEENVEVRCFLDAFDIDEGSNWEKTFLNGLKRSCVFLPLVSAAAIKPIEDVSVFDDKADNLLLEYETALRLARQSRITILPLLVGTLAEDGRGGTVESKFASTEFDVSRFPRGPSKTNSKRPVRETMRDLFKVQGLFVSPLGLADGEVQTIMSFLQNKAWSSRDPDCLNLKRFWHDSADADKHSSGRGSGHAGGGNKVGIAPNLVGDPEVRYRSNGPGTGGPAALEVLLLEGGAGDEDL